MIQSLEKSRERIDEIDREISSLFIERMKATLDVVKYKEENNMEILDSSREDIVIENVTRPIEDEMVEYVKSLYSSILSISKSYQGKYISSDSKVQTEIKETLENAKDNFPKKAIVACQGTKGSNSMIACKKMFSVPNVMYMESFDAIFKAVDSGLCEYGILPIENNLHGSVIEVYDLMKKHEFKIVRSVKVQINHVLLAKTGSKIKDIKTIYSHPQAIGQCSDFLEKNPNIKVINYDNTATSAEYVASLNDPTVAAIASKECAKIYNLEVLNDTVQNSNNNFTRFICIAKEGEIYKGSNKISLMFTLPHSPGALSSVISTFSNNGVNVSKLESRPISGMNFEFIFYIDFDGDISDNDQVKLLAQIENTTDILIYLGSYWEI